MYHRIMFVFQNPLLHGRNSLTLVNDKLTQYRKNCGDFRNLLASLSSVFQRLGKFIGSLLPPFICFFFGALFLKHGCILFDSLFASYISLDYPNYLIIVPFLITLRWTIMKPAGLTHWNFKCIELQGRLNLQTNDKICLPQIWFKLVDYPEDCG